MYKLDIPILVLLKSMLFTLVVSGHAAAKQTNFSKVLVDKEYQFSYQWIDHLNRTQTIDFAFPQKTIFNRYRDFAIFQPKLAQEYVNKALRKHFKKSPMRGVQISFTEENGNFQANIRSTDQQLIQQTSAKITQLEQKYNQEYLTKKYYHQFATPEQIIAIKPDHGRIANESVNDFKALKPIILKQSSIKNIRKVSNYVLSFVQSIPYSTLESRVTSSGAGFSPPLKLLWENQGDCDSKVTLTASMLRTLMPRIKMALVYIENHALIGIDIEPKDNDITVTDNDVTYVLAEPTGPAVFALGKIAPSSEQAIFNGHYSLEAFHAKPRKRTEGQAITNDSNSG